MCTNYEHKVWAQLARSPQHSNSQMNSFSFSQTILYFSCMKLWTQTFIKSKITKKLSKTDMS